MRGDAGVEQLEEREEQAKEQAAGEEPEDTLEDVDIVRHNDESNVEWDISRLSIDISQLAKDDRVEEEIPFPHQEDKSYEDIKITPGVRFDELAPTD